MQDSRPLVPLLSPQTGIVTGIAAEARCARRFAQRVSCSGGDPARAAHQSWRLIDEGATALMSFGIAGGLGAALPSGTLIVADAVVTDRARTQADPTWAASLGAIVGPIYSGNSIVHDVGEKARLAARTGAIAIDLESGPVALAAAEAGIPFMAVRAIADPAWHGLPPAALLPLDEQGRPRLAAIFGSILKNPGQIPSLVVTALDARTAMKALFRAGRVLAG